MTGIHFSSNSEEIRYYEKQLLEDGMVHTREELFAYAKTQSANGGRFTEGMLSGATRDLVRNSNGLYFSPARGKYQKAVCKIGAAAGESLQPIMIDYLENMCQGLENICTVNLMNFSGTENLTVIEHAKSIHAFLKEKIWVLWEV